MKKFFSAILLMTMMVFSVGTFVSCNDLVTEIEDVKGQTTEQAAAIKALENEIAALETALATAQKAADDAKAAANDAKAAAAQAKADAIADAKAQVEALKTALETAIAEKADKAEVDAMAKDVEAALAVINTSIAKLAEKDAMLDGEIAELLQADKGLQAQIDALKAYGKDSSDSLVVELSALQNELDQLWQTIGSETGLQALVGTQAGLITNLQADLQNLAESIFGEGAESLYTLVGQNAGMIQELLDRMDAADAAIVEINEALSVYTTILQAFAEQIQSVVYVPENTDGTVTASSYVLGRYASDILVKLTYEVTPNELAAKVTSDKVYFNAVPVTSTKAAAAEVVKAEVVKTDANTGRVEVYARINASNKATYAALTDATKNQDIQLSLNIADRNPIVLPGEELNTVDPGTVYAVDYVPVLFDATKLNQNVLGLVKFYNTKTEKWVEGVADANGNYDNVNVITEPYTTTAPQSVLGIYDVRVDVEGQAMTPAQAAEFIGTAINVTYTTTDFAYAKKDGTALNLPYDKDYIPFTTVKNGLASTAQIVAPAKGQLNQTVGYTASTTVKGIKVNGNDATNTVELTGTLKIDYAKAAITFATYDAGKWSYKNGLQGNYCIVTIPSERAVSANNIDITTLSYDIDDDGQLENINGQTLVLEAVAKTTDAMGNPYEVAGTANVKILSSKAVSLTGFSAPFLTHQATYEARFSLIDEKTNISYDVAFDIVLGPRPTDKEIDLTSFTADAALEHEVIIPVGEAAAKILAVDAAYYADFLTDCAAGTDLGGFIYPAQKLNPKDVITWFGGMNSAVTTPENSEVELILEYDTDAMKEKSYIRVDGIDKFDAAYTLKQTYEIFGIKYTFVAKVNFQKPAYAINANPVLVKNGVATLDGTVTIPELNSGKTGLTSGDPYKLNAIYLSQYIVVSDAVKAEIAKGELKIVYTLADTRDYDQNPFTPAEPVRYVTIDGVGTTVDANNNLVAPTSTWDETTESKGFVTWGGNNYENALNFVITLEHATKKENGKPVVFSTIPVQTVVPELIKLEAPAAKVVTVAYKNGAEDTKANIAGALVVKDVKTGKEIYNSKQADRTLAQIWHGYKKTSKGWESTGVEVFNLYNQVITIDAKNIKAYLETSKYELTAADYSVETDATKDNYGEVKLLLDNANLTENIIVEVPVKLTHDYCGTPHTAVAKVKITK